MKFCATEPDPIFKFFSKCTLTVFHTRSDLRNKDITFNKRSKTI